jgi:organic radical activating enzyme
MDFFNRLIDRVFTPAHTLPAGMYHYQAPADAPIPYRMHLRIEPDGLGILILNASTVLHLNHSATEFAYYLVKQVPEEEAIQEILRRYHINREEALKDYRDLVERIQTLVKTPDLDPEIFMDFERRDPYSTAISAPYRLDCALTYQCPGGTSDDLAPDTVKRELLTEEWETILQKAWDAGIPHVIFTGGEPTLRADLADLIAYTQKIGQVVGVITDGLRLSETAYLHKLLQSGLDHLMILLDPRSEQSWEALRDVLAEGIFTTVHITITQKNVSELEALFDRLAKMGVISISISADDPDLKDAVTAARHAVADRKISLVWDLPVPYSEFHPVALELAEHEQPAKGAGIAWLYIEPDGDVLPAQGVQTVLGNLLTDPWEKIWKSR